MKKRKRGRPKGRCMDTVREDMAEVEVMEEDTEDRNNWRWKICGDHDGRSRNNRRRSATCCTNVINDCGSPRDWICAVSLVTCSYLMTKLQAWMSSPSSATDVAMMIL